VKRFGRLAAVAAVAVGFSLACSDNRDLELELQQRQLAALEEAQRLEAATIEAGRLEAERLRRAEEERSRREGLARNYSRSAGRQIMDAIGGGQDLIVRHGQWTFDATTRELEIPMEVSFNGLFVRSNNYRVAGVLTVSEDGTSPQFARSGANQTYLDMEGTVTALQLTAAGAMVLNELAQDTGR
jgi:hypothetical protein